MERGLLAAVARSVHWGEVLRLGDHRALISCHHCGLRVIVPLGQLRPMEGPKGENARL